MKILIKPQNNITDYQNIDGIILPLKDYAVDYDTYYSLEEITQIKENFHKEIFVVLNRMYMNEDIPSLTEILLELDKLNLTGIFFYDLAVLDLKQELNLKTDLVWNATHMITNYRTCDYYYEKGVKYAYLSNEITLEESLEIKEKSQIIPMFTVLSYPVVANSYRRLITNYNKMHNLDNKNTLEVVEKITNDTYKLEETEYGTTFKYGKILNNVSALPSLKEVNFPYIILNEDGIDHNVFLQVLTIITKNILEDTKVDEVYNLIANNTGFLNKKTIYKVKKDV